MCVSVFCAIEMNLVVINSIKSPLNSFMHYSQTHVVCGGLIQLVELSSTRLLCWNRMCVLDLLVVASSLVYL